MPDDSKRSKPGRAPQARASRGKRKGNPNSWRATGNSSASLERTRRSPLMCAIAGLYDVAGQAVEPSVLERMVCLQAHRGPDGEGYVLLDVQGREQPVALKGRLTDALGASPRASVSRPFNATGCSR